MWPEQCVDGLNAGQSDIRNIQYQFNLLPYRCVSIKGHRSYIIYYSVAPVVRSGETDPEVAKYLNRYEPISLLYKTICHYISFLIWICEFYSMSAFENCI